MDYKASSVAHSDSDTTHASSLLYSSHSSLQRDSSSRSTESVVESRENSDWAVAATDEETNPDAPIRELKYDDPIDHGADVVVMESVSRLPPSSIPTYTTLLFFFSALPL